jgi:ribulose-bisphosphate carboxylase large chain
VGTIVKPKLGLRPEPFAEACYRFWLGGDFVKNDEPQGNQPFAPLRRTVAAVAEAMRRAQDKTGQAKIFSANITADDPWEMVARGECILEAFGENAPHVAFLVDGYVAGPRPDHRPGGVSRPVSPLSPGRARRRDLAPVPARLHRVRPGKMARLQGASGMHVGTMGFGKMEGDPADRSIAFMIERDAADGPYFHQNGWA